MKTILLVEDDDRFREAVKAILLKKYNIIESNNGKSAREILAITPVDLVLSDIQMPFFTGIDLLEWVRKHKPVPVILITGFSHILEARQAAELGASGFLMKPFKENELLEKIVEVIGEDKAKEEDRSKPRLMDLDKKFCKLPIEDFISEREMEYELFIRVAPNKYIKILHKGGQISQDRLKVYKEKGVTHFYIAQEDFSKVVGFTVLISKAVSRSGQVDRAKKTRFMQYTGEMIMQQAFVSGTDEALFKNAKDFLTTSMDILTQDEETFSLLQLLSNHTDYLYAHSLGVSVFSVMIAKQLGWQSPQTLFKLAFAGLFHDIGKKEIPIEILEKPRSLLTQQERAHFESHTTRGMEILRTLKTTPSEVIQVAYEHHEDVLGQGFPQGLDKSRIHPFSLIVAVANAFCEYTIKGPHSTTQKNAQTALADIQTFKLASLDKKSFEALQKVVLSEEQA